MQFDEKSYPKTSYRNVTLRCIVNKVVSFVCFFFLLWQFFAFVNVIVISLHQHISVLRKTFRFLLTGRHVDCKSIYSNCNVVTCKLHFFSSTHITYIILMLSFLHFVYVQYIRTHRLYFLFQRKRGASKILTRDGSQIKIRMHDKHPCSLTKQDVIVMNHFQLPIKPYVSLGLKNSHFSFFMLWIQMVCDGEKEDDAVLIYTCK